MVYFELLSLYTRVRALVLNSCSIHLHKNSKFIGYSLASYKSLNKKQRSQLRVRDWYASNYIKNISLPRLGSSCSSLRFVMIFTSNSDKYFIGKVKDERAELIWRIFASVGTYTYICLSRYSTLISK